MPKNYLWLQLEKALGVYDVKTLVLGKEKRLLDAELCDCALDEAVASFEYSKPEDNKWYPGESYHDAKRGSSDYYEMYSSLLEKS